jgi:hypothetical protein
MATQAARPLRTDVLSTSEVAELGDRLAAAITPLDDPSAWKPRNGA